MTGMAVLVLGAGGMLGSAVTRELAAQGFAVTVAARTALAGLPPGVAALPPADLRAPDAAARLVAAARPAAVVNCAGMVKQRPDAADPVTMVEVNAALPHRLAAACASQGARLVQIGTDCVFSGDPAGRRGPAGYRETDPTDPMDLYGRSKLLGETTAPGCLTLRMSLIGHEPSGAGRGLVEWFLAAPGPVQGFARALFTGLTCPVAARLVADVLHQHPGLAGLWHAAAPPISKLDLLCALRDRARPGLEVVPVPGPLVDRRLDGSAFMARTGWQAPGWDAMLDELLPGVGPGLGPGPAAGAAPCAR